MNRTGEQDRDAPDIARLVRGAAEGDRAAWERLVDQYARLIWAITVEFKLIESDAADVAQTTWLRLLEHIDRIEYPDRVGSWLAATARNECLRSLASRKRVVLGHDDTELASAVAHQPEIDERLLADERAATVRDALSHLPRRWQRLLELLMSDPPASYAEISDELGLPIGSIGPTRGRCLARLRVLLQASLLARYAVKFPIAPHTTAGSYFDAYADEISRAGKTIETAALDHAAALLVGAYERGARAFTCGNGGSASIANHMQCDHVKGIRRSTDLTPKVLSLSNNMELVTAVANDLGYENIFVYQLQSQSAPGDVLIAVSSSGRSPNIVNALTWARDHGLRTIAVTGFDGGASRTVAEVSIHVDSTNYGVVEDLHQVIMHALAQYIRQSRMSADAISASVF